MKHFILIYTFLSCFIFVSCNRNIDNRLAKAEQLMETAPDSSLHILQKLNAKTIRGSYNRALYALLMSQALDKNDIKIETDSLITIATDYFDDSDPVHAGYAWFYHARTALNRDSVNEEAKNLLKAQEFAEIAGDNKLLGLIYGDKGKMYAAQKQTDSAICYSKKAYYTFSKIKDNDNSIIALLNTATEYVKKTQFDSIRYYYYIAHDIAKHTHNKIIISSIYRNIGITYFQQGNYRLALKNYREAPLTGNKLYDSNKYYLIAGLYVKINQPDSAVYYLRKVSELGAMAPDYYRLWQRISLYKSDRNRALYYANKVSFATDSLYKRKLEASFAGLEKKYKFQGLQINYKNLDIENKKRGFFLLLALLTLSIFGVIVLFWRLRVKRNEVEYQKDIANKKQELLEREKENTAKERENNILLERQLKLQSILLLNLEQHRSNTVKQPGLWKTKNKEIKSERNKTFNEELLACMDIEFNNISIRLKEKYPELTDNDIITCCMILAGFETGMIATVFDVNNDSIFIRRSRVRKKLKLEESVKLEQFLREF